MAASARNACSSIANGEIELAFLYIGDGNPVYERGANDPEGEAPGERQMLSFLAAGTATEASITCETLIP